MKLLCLADLHSSETAISTLSKIPKEDFDAIVLLGDISDFILAYVQDNFIHQKFGVVGNHDNENALDKHNINNINGKLLTIDDIRFTGIQGSFMYKNAQFPSFTQSGSLMFSVQLDYADILISHTSPLGVHEKDQDVHVGLIGIQSYINKNRPVYCLHGHQHINEVTQLDNGTTVIGMYGILLFEVLTGHIKQL